MARKRTLSPALERLRQTQAAILEGRRMVAESPLRLLLSIVSLQECAGVEGDPEAGCVDPAAAVIRVNPHSPHREGYPRGAEDWAALLGHMLLHLGLNHAARREDREPLLWNVACDRA